MEESEQPNQQLHESFLTAEHDRHDEIDRQKNQSVSAVFDNKRSGSQIPQIIRIKHELMANSHDESIASESDQNPYEYYDYGRSQSVGFPSGMNSDMLVFNEKGPSKLDKRLIKQREERENELLAYQNDSIEPVLSGGEKVFTETAKEQEARIRKNSPFGGLLTWKLMRIIVKSNDDIRQEQFAMQLISQFDQIFKLKKLDLWLNPYEILGTG